MNITTPALLFPAISLLLLAYTNRFVVLAQLVRQLRRSLEGNNNTRVVLQIENLRTRLRLIRRMQALAVMSFLFSTLAMLLRLFDLVRLAETSLGAALLLLSASLFCSLIEILLSTTAIEIELHEVSRSVASEY